MHGLVYESNILNRILRSPHQRLGIERVKPRTSPIGWILNYMAASDLWSNENWDCWFWAMSYTMARCGPPGCWHQWPLLWAPSWIWWGNRSYNSATFRLRWLYQRRHQIPNWTFWSGSWGLTVGPRSRVTWTKRSRTNWPMLKLSNWERTKRVWCQMCKRNTWRADWLSSW